MAATPPPIIFKITDAGKNAALSGVNTGISTKLTQLAIGNGKRAASGSETALRAELSRHPIISGDVETDSHTLRFSSTITASSTTQVFELGLMTDDNVLFAVASTTGSQPLITIHPDISFVGSFGLSLTEVAAGSVTVTTDPNGTLSLVIMENHLAAVDPHPQYINTNRFQFLMRSLIPLGYLHHSHVLTNPKPAFDELLGIDTQWRRLKGKIIVATDPDDTYIKNPSVILGQKGMSEVATGQRPHVYPLQTTHVFERYDPANAIETVWSISSNKNNVDEGGSVRFTIMASNVPDGQILNWSAKEGVLNAENNNITNVEKTESGTVILRNGQATIDFKTTPDENLEEPQKHIRLTVGAPANLSINIPINDAGHNETVVHISQSIYSGLVLDEYYKTHSGQYPSINDTIRFIVDSGVDIVAPNVSTPGVVEGSNWPASSSIVIENRGRILGHGGNGGRSAYQHTVGNPVKAKIRGPQPGGDGGTAIKSLAKAILVENYSFIAGGGGGGGGLGAYKAPNYNFVVGGGGTGGGAPYGKRSPNESTYTMYLQDPAFPDARLPLPNNGRFYKILNHGHDLAFANWPGTSGDYTYASSFNASSADEERYVFIEIMTNKVAQATGDFTEYRTSTWSGEIPAQGSLNLKMSQNASLELRGVGGAGLSLIPSSYFPALNKYPAGSNPTATRGGHGGDFGENGENGSFEAFYQYGDAGDNTVITAEDTEWYIPSAAGGKAGRVFEGNVTINNLTGGTTKGRTP